MRGQKLDGQVERSRVERSRVKGQALGGSQGCWGTAEEVKGRLWWIFVIRRRYNLGNTVNELLFS